MKKTFEFNKTSRIWLYGAATTGVLTDSYLSKYGYKVEGFLDKRAKEVKTLCDKRVLSLDELVAENEDLDDIVVLITVKNVFEHERIVANLISYKIYNVIYFPSDCLKGNGTVDERKLYVLSNSISKKQEIEECSLPKTFKLMDLKFEDGSVIKEKEEKVTVMLSFMLVFTDKKMKSKEYCDKVDVEENKISDKNILTLVSHIRFFDFLGGEKGSDYLPYVEFCEKAARRLNEFSITDEWKANVFKNRVEVFENMNMEYEKKTDFFVNNAPDVEWNEKGYFNLISGKHRAAFLVAKGDWYIPVTIKKIEYEKLFLRSETSIVKAIIKELGIRELQAPVEHPLFDNIPCNAKTFWYTLIRKLSLYLYNAGFSFHEDSSVLIDVDDLGFLARFFIRMGIRVQKIQRGNGYDRLESAINNMMYCKGIENVGGDEISIVPDCVITDKLETGQSIECPVKFYIVDKIIDDDRLKLISTGASHGVPCWMYMEI